MDLQFRDFKLRERPISSGRALPAKLPELFQGMLNTAEELLAEPLKGVTTNGTVTPNLYTGTAGAPTGKITTATEAFLNSLDADQRANTVFHVDSDKWRRWSNIHPYLMRHGAYMDEMTDKQRDLTIDILRQSMSPYGFQTARDIMKLNESILEISGSHDEYGEWLYWLSVMGEPSSTEPWGWQIDGHHLIINCFVRGDKLVMTPMFMGSEPVAVDIGKYAGTRVFKAEEDAAIALAGSLDKQQRSKALISEVTPPEVFTTAFRDNFELKYEGIRFDELTNNQQGLLLDVAHTFVVRMPEDHARIKMDEIKEHLGETYLAWMGGFESDSMFYYRIHSPVTLIEFDHQNGVALDYPNPTRNHIHSVMRTPNGNDYGADLLRQHREQFSHSHD